MLGPRSVHGCSVGKAANAKQAGMGTCDEGAVLGDAGLDPQAWAGHAAIRREHVLRGGSLRRRHARHPRLWNRCARAGPKPAGDGSARPLRGHVLISHTHWDHIQGMPVLRALLRARQ